MRATSISFEKRYTDDSGVEFRVALVDDQVVFADTRCKVVMPVEVLPWIVQAVGRLWTETNQPEE